MGDQYQVAVLKGAAEAAALAGANLMCFVGGGLPHDPNAEGRHRIYELCGPRTVDAVVVLGSTLSHSVGKDALARYCERYRPLPLCSVGIAMSDAPSITVDNDVGVRRLVEHLVREHGAQRIAFVRGPLKNAEAELRSSAYRAALAEHGLPFDERLVATGSFISASGKDAVFALSETPGLELTELDAIVASNDAMALGVLAALEQSGIAVPSQIAVVGFDDIEDARLTRPPLTTVRQPFEKLGSHAVKMVMEWLSSGKPPPSEQLDTEPVIRRSCGCSLPSGRAGPSLAPERSLGFEAALLMKRERIIDALTRLVEGSFEAAGADWAGRLLNALMADLRNPEPGAFVMAFDSMLEKLIVAGIDLNLCDEVLGALREHLVPLLRSDRVRGERAEDLFHLARVATSHAIQRVLTGQRLQVARWTMALNRACNAIASSFDLQELRARLVDVMPTLVGIECCLVVLYTASEERASARLLVGYDRALGAAYPESASFEPSSLLPPDVVVTAEPGSTCVVLPLVWQTECLGHMLVRFDLEHAFAVGALAGAVSVGIHGAQLAERKRPPAQPAGGHAGARIKG